MSFSIRLISVTPAGDQGNSDSNYYGHPGISADGRYVVFNSYASDLVAGDTNGTWDVFRRDTQAGITTLVGRASDGTQANNYTYDPSISADGRYVVYWSPADNLIANDTNGLTDIFRTDTQTGTTIRVSVTGDGSQANGYSWQAASSATGRYITFSSGADNLVSNITNGGTTRLLNDTNGYHDIFLRDTFTGLTTLVSRRNNDRVADTDPTPSATPDGESANSSVSADGRYVVYDSFASNIIDGERNYGARGIFLYDVSTNKTVSVSHNAAGQQAAGGGRNASISADGKWVVFQSDSKQLTADATTGFSTEIYLYEVATTALTRISRAPDGSQGDRFSGTPSISDDGRYIVYTSNATNLVANDTNGFVNDVFRYDRTTGTTEILSRNAAGQQGNSDSYGAGISGNGQAVAFWSQANNLDPVDLYTNPDIYWVSFSASTAPSRPNITGVALQEQSGASFTLRGTASAGLVVTVLADGRAIGTATTDDTGLWSFSNTTPLVNGSRSLSATVASASGVSSAQAVPVTLVVAPSGGTITHNGLDGDLLGGAGNDALFGGVGDDVIQGGVGDDTLDGGTGNDAANYINAPAGVTVSLALGTAQNTVGAGTDVLAGFEYLYGSGFDDTLSGDPGANFISGGNGNDNIALGGGDDSGYGDDGNDSIDGGAGADTLVGGAGNDLLTGGADNDRLEGGDGDDILIGGAGADLFLGGDGLDLVSYANSASAVQIDLTYPGQAATGGEANGDTFSESFFGSGGIEGIIAGNFADTLTGGATDNYLDGGGGNDSIDGGGGNDSLMGGAGNDTILGGAGADTLAGGAGIDLFADSRDAWQAGWTEFDVIDYSASPAAVNMGLYFRDVGAGGDAQGDRFADGDNQNSYYYRLTGSRFGDTLGGNDAENWIIGGAGNDSIGGGGSNDTLEGGEGADTLNGGSQFDTAFYGNSNAGVVIDLTANTATGGEAAGDRFNSIEGLWGSSFADQLRSNAGGNELIGDAGDDTLEGAAGADRLVGGEGFDFASYANAAIGVTARLDYPSLNTGDAAADSYSGIEGLIGSNFYDFLVGDAGDNIVFAGGSFDYVAGNAGNDIIFGQGGNDTLDGFAGDDTLVGGAGADSLIGGEGIDFASYADALLGVVARLDYPSLNTGDAAADNYAGIEGLVGSNFYDFLVGDAGDNIVFAGGSFDYVAGNAGNDTILGEDGNDTLDGGAGNDTLLGGAAADSLIGGGGIDFASYADALQGIVARLDFPSLNTGDAAGDSYSGISGFIGTGFGDTLVGNAGAQTLLGGAGEDRLFGGQGADVLHGGADQDFFVFDALDFQSGVYDIINDMNIGGTADWFTTTGVARSSIWAVDYQAGVVVTVSSLGFGLTGGGVFIENFTTTQFWSQLYTV